MAFLLRKSAFLVLLILCFCYENSKLRDLSVFQLKNTLRSLWLDITVPYKQDTANAPFHNRPNVYKSRLTALPDF
jgi:hypothetical protein